MEVKTVRRVEAKAVAAIQVIQAIVIALSPAKEVRKKASSIPTTQKMLLRSQSASKPDKN